MRARSLAHCLPVHPRGRGEHYHLVSTDAAGTGSSPRARGTRLPSYDCLVDLWFIPAGAGNTDALLRGICLRPVHPRGRGEHVVPNFFIAISNGSSPRARGTRTSRGPGAIIPRFIPAGAGNTSDAAAKSAEDTVHPRGRGEHARNTKISITKSGSSPRARGTPGAIRPSPGQTRFIPAGAGNTFRIGKATLRDSVHPRGRGEHPIQLVRCYTKIGSSPRARGTPAVAYAKAWRERFIPAGAGNTLSPRHRFDWRAVHPRGRGEHAASASFRANVVGSSPRARGTPKAKFVKAQVKRFIPAGAGNTHFR